MKWIYSFSSGILLTLAFILSGGMPKSVNTNTPQVEQELPRHAAGVPMEEMMAPGTIPSPQASGGNGVSGINSWDKIAFESIRDGNWEIYTSNADGSNSTRLTLNSASDIEPRMTRGAQRIVFASNRTGNYELYTMNADGSNLIRLTFTNSNNYNPTWSPDGTRIAFESYRDGQAEVYIMFANGTGQLRLTVNPGFDGEPTWSPDGTRIAFASYRNNQNRIWVMYFDGSGQAQISDLPYSENPTWSPVRDSIAFDADSNYSGFQSIWIISSTGGGSSLVRFDGAPNDDLPRSWSPDGQNVIYTGIHWVNIGGTWQWTNADLLACVSFECNYPQSLGGVGLDLDPDCVSSDILAPVSHMLPLPRYSRSSGFQIDWGGSDSGPSGIADYSIFVRFGETGTWSSWWYQPVSFTTYQFPGGTPGDKIYFRSQAVDRAGNVEPVHSSSYDSFTQLYTNTIDGKIRDNRGNTLTSVPLILNPQALETMVTDTAGAFLGHLTGKGSYALSAQSPGYSNLPPATLNITTDTHQDLSLPPLVDLAQNGGFEAGSLANWQTSPAAPAVISTTQIHTGQFSAQIGKNTPSGLTNLTNSTGSTNGMQHILRDSTNTEYVYWYDSSLQATVYRKHLAGGDWSPETIACWVNLDSMSLGPDNTVYSVWDARNYSSQTSSIWFGTMVIGGTCSTPVKLSGDFGYIDWAPLPTIAVSQSGDVHIVWYEFQVGIRYAHKTNSGAWSTQTLPFSGDNANIVLTSDNTLHLTWAATNSGLMYAHMDANGVWSVPELIENTFVSHPGNKLFADANGHIFSTLYFWDIYMSELLPDGSWSPELNMTQLTNNDVVVSSDFSPGPDGTLHLIWNDYNLNHLFYRVRYPDGAWSPAWDFRSPVVIAVSNPHLVHDSTGTAHVVWCEKTGDVATDIMYSELSFPLSNESNLSQTISIPANSHKPTLSFAYKLDNVFGNDVSFQVKANDTVLFSTASPTTGWVYAWYDLSALAGQDVIITFTSQSGAGSLPMTATIDEVSVGDWLTPQVTSATPAQINSYDGAIITLHGENFIATPTVRIDNTPLTNVVWIDAQTLQATIPSGILPGWHDVWVVNPQGQANILPHSIFLGRQIFLPTISRP